MKSRLLVIGCIVLIVTSFSFLLINTHFGNASVICVDKYNDASVIPCSDQNAIHKNIINQSLPLFPGGSTTIGAGNALFNAGIPNTQGTSSPQPIKQNTKASGCGTAVINGTLTSYCLNSPVIQPHSDTRAAQSNTSSTSSGSSQEPVAKQNDRYYEGLNWWGV